MPKSEDAGWSSHLSPDSDALMVDSFSTLVVRRSEVLRGQRVLVSWVGAALLIALCAPARGESSGSKIVIRIPATTELQQPTHFTPLPSGLAGGERRTQGGEPEKSEGLRAKSGEPEKNAGPPPSALRPPPHAGLDAPSSRRQPLGEVQQASPVDATTYLRMRAQSQARQVNFQTPKEPPTTGPPETLPSPAVSNDPCAGLINRPFSEFGISTAMPNGEFPTDFAMSCWVPINQSAGPLAGIRFWGASTYAWEATCLCHRPLYFEEINLERYGYGCCETLQPAASAAHFFGTIPALPYCMALYCPGECNYTLGHYRPGSCPPKQCHWPPCSPRAILAEGGVWTGMIFLIP